MSGFRTPDDEPGQDYDASDEQPETEDEDEETTPEEE